jgi:beta-lactamase regulating signal transducer with metallopeptidase domain
MFQDMQHVPANIGLMQTPKIDIGLNTLNQIINKTLPAATPINSVNPMQIIIFAMSTLWLVGICILVTYSLLSYFILRFRLRYAIKECDDVYISDRILTPFVLGLVKPRIYLPARVSLLERVYIIEHERTHIQSLDHFTKMLSFFIVCVHWFNPLAWLSFKLFSKDLEIRCDERVLNGKDKITKSSYATSLLSYSGNRSTMLPNPLAFGESNTKSRIKRILSYKKPAFIISAFALVSIFILGFAVLSNPKDSVGVSIIGKNRVSSISADKFEMDSQMNLVLVDSFVITDKAKINSLVIVLNKPIEQKLTMVLDISIFYGNNYFIKIRYEDESELTLAVTFETIPSQNIYSPGQLKVSDNFYDDNNVYLLTDDDVSALSSLLR